MLPIQPVTLETDRLMLRPMSLDDVPAFGEAARDGNQWEKKTTTVPRPEGFEEYVRRALELQAAGLALPFTTVVKDGNRVVGSTRFMNIDAVNQRVEIGTTWIAKSWQRTFVNTHAKFLMLRHAFEVLGCNAVEIRTHSQNDQSRAAIERLGAKLDGILRRHMIMPDGHIRDTAVYSILPEEWPAVKARLEQRMST
ncbi:GNAT family N-acetyltransferase [Microvirga guangxiensis]|uniref:Protein N-acetyltransferase, RimJ/RimL family n=1 Tax=Microvirga guangxiensis TaxID=549386 RepID=A0A1G5K4H3_9HYPH|nr:GNAT family protein [Microvirga guangxiensis]SCY95565.1 Protein N-acetyltransferase, RimJ/RimL family [Microvirga guangxiensis]